MAGKRKARASNPVRNSQAIACKKDGLNDLSGDGYSGADAEVTNCRQATK
jgi:hypothetical protein